MPVENGVEKLGPCYLAKLAALCMARSTSTASTRSVPFCYAGMSQIEPSRLH
jgi:hypothetical protein